MGSFFQRQLVSISPFLNQHLWLLDHFCSAATFGNVFTVGTTKAAPPSPNLPCTHPSCFHGLDLLSVRNTRANQWQGRPGNQSRLWLQHLFLWVRRGGGGVSTTSTNAPYTPHPPCSSLPGDRALSPKEREWHLCSQGLQRARQTKAALWELLPGSPGPEHNCCGAPLPAPYTALPLWTYSNI